MQLMVTTADGQVFPVDVAEEMELENFFALCQSESDSLRNVDSGRLVIMFDGKYFDDKKVTLKNIGLKEGDLLMIQVKRPNNVSNASNNNLPRNAFTGLDFSSIRLPSQQRASTTSNTQLTNPAAIGQMILADPSALNHLRQQNPPLAQALESGDMGRFAQLFEEIRKEQQQERERQMRILANPFDPEAQRLLEQQIQRQHVQENMEFAMEHTPESFGYVTMLYIRCKVNGHEVKAFVDSGAQSTIMSVSCARECNVTRLIDERFTGIAKGVGTSKILGRIHLAQLQIGNDFLPTSFTVLEDQGVDMLLGLDMLKRHQCMIDLKNNKLIIGTTGGETEFLHENELPANARSHPTDHGQSDDGHLDQAIADSLKDQIKQTAGNSLVPASGLTPSTSMARASAVTEHSLSADEVKIQKLVTMGFKREDVVAALKLTNGNVDAATSMLIVKSLPSPPVPKK